MLTTFGVKALWRAVLVQACKDLRIRPDTQNTELILARLGAHEWFKTAGADFREVCENAGYDPKKVQEAYFAGALDKPFPVKRSM